MPVDSLHDNYAATQGQWQRCRDAVKGKDAIVAGEGTYTPKPSGLDDREFERYTQRGSWFGATARTIEAMTGLIFRKDPEFQIASGQEALIDMATADGLSLREIADAAVDNILQTTRFGILVDHPTNDPNQQRTVADAENSGDRPYLSTYLSESIINWNFRVFGSRRLLSRVILLETRSDPDPEDEFVPIKTTQWRELSLDDLGFYFQRVWTKDEEGEFVATAPLYPQIQGGPFTFIPFFTASTMGDDIDAMKPPVLDLVDVNISHWNNSCDYEHGLHFTGNPMPVITGYSNDDDGPIVIGSETAMVISDPQAKAYYMEFEGTGLGTLEKAMGTKETQMAALGSRILMEDKKGVEAAETASIHRAGENSVLGSIASSVSKVLTRAYRVMSIWAGADPDEVKIQLNTDFLPFALDAATMTSLMGLWQMSVISKRTLFQKLQEGEAIPPGIDFEEDQDLITQEGIENLPVVTDAGTV